MKKYFLLAAGIVLTAILAASCSQDSLVGENSSNEAMISLNVTLPGSPATRAYSDGYSATNLYYAVYEAGEEADTYITDGTAKFENSLTTTVTVALVKGVTYKLAFWAQSPNATCYTFDAKAQTVSVAYSGAECNDEDRDAFYKVEEYTPKSSTGSLDVELYRPFAQINFLTNDFDQPAVKDYVTNMKSSIVITGNAYTTLDLLSGDADDYQNVTFSATAIPSGEKSPVSGYEYVAMTYVLVGGTPNESQVYKDDFTTVTLNVASTSTASGNEMKVEVPVSNVPVQRNYRTNIYGALLTESASFNVEIVPAYAEPDYDIPYPVEVSASDSNGNTLIFDTETNTASVDVAAETTEYSFNLTVDESTSWTVTADNASAELSQTSTTALTKADETTSEEESETTLPSISGTGPATITVTIPANESTTETVTTNVSIAAEGATTLTIAITQDIAEEPYTLVGDGTIDNPYTVADALYLINNSLYDSAEVYVKGKVSHLYLLYKVDGIARMRYYISDDGTETDQLYVYNGLNLGRGNFSSLYDLSIEDEVIICGALTLYTSYSGTTTPELDENNYLYSLNGVTDYLYTDVTSLSVSSDGGEVSFTVTSNVEYSVSSSDETNFVAEQPEEGTVTVTCEANTGTEARTATITVTPADGSGASAVEVVITQSAPLSEDSTYYVKVTSEPDSWAGKYLIVYEDGPYAFDGSLTSLDGAGDYQTVTITDSAIEFTEAVDALSFTIAAVDGGYSIQSASGYYIGRTGSTNGLNTSTSDDYVNTISYDATNGLVITSSGGPTLQFYSSGSNSRFRFYASTQKAVSLYKLAE